MAYMFASWKQFSETLELELLGLDNIPAFLFRSSSSDSNCTNFGLPAMEREKKIMERIAGLTAEKCAKKLEPLRYERYCASCWMNMISEYLEKSLRCASFNFV